MGSPKVVLALGLTLVTASLLALWWTAESRDKAPSFEEPALEEPSPQEPFRAPLAQKEGAKSAVSDGSRAAASVDAGASDPSVRQLRPGVNAPLPPDQWPARVRPTPRTVVTPPPPEDLPQVSKEEIREAVNAVKPLVARCFTDNAQKYLGDQRVVLKFTIQGQGLSGHFKDGEVVESTIVDPWVQACFLEALTDASFPPPSGGGTVTVTYPFSFVDARDAGATGG